MPARPFSAEPMPLPRVVIRPGDTPHMDGTSRFAFGFEGRPGSFAWARMTHSAADHLAAALERHGQPVSPADVGPATFTYLADRLTAALDSEEAVEARARAIADARRSPAVPFRGQVLAAANRAQAEHALATLLPLLAVSGDPAAVARLERRAATAEQALAVEERAHEATLARVEELEDTADALAYAIAPMEVIGEHTSSNDPWANALDHAYAGDVGTDPEVDERRRAAREAHADAMRGFGDDSTVVEDGLDAVLAEALRLAAACDALTVRARSAEGDLAVTRVAHERTREALRQAHALLVARPVLVPGIAAEVPPIPIPAWSHDPRAERNAARDAERARVMRTLRRARAGRSLGGVRG